MNSNNNIDFFPFSKRIKLVDMFEKWAEEKGVKNCNKSMIAFLLVKGCLNTEKAKELIENEK